MSTTRHLATIFSTNTSPPTSRRADVRITGAYFKIFSFSYFSLFYDFISRKYIFVEPTLFIAILKQL